MRFVFHPHAESHVETDEQILRFLAGTDPDLVGLCLDTGHVAYTHGDAPRLLREHASRTWYVHLKAVDPGVLARVEAERLSFADAVKLDVMCEPGLGVPALDDLIPALGSLPAWHVRDRRAGPVPVRVRPAVSHRRAHAQDPPRRRNRVNP